MLIGNIMDTCTGNYELVSHCLIREGIVFKYPHNLHQIVESKVTFDNSLKLSGAQGVDQR